MTTTTEDARALAWDKIRAYVETADRIGEADHIPLGTTAAGLDTGDLRALLPVPDVGLVEDLERRAQACSSLAFQYLPGSYDLGRVDGKGQAYHHAAELAAAPRPSPQALSVEEIAGVIQCEFDKLGNCCLVSDGISLSAQAIHARITAGRG